MNVNLPLMSIGRVLVPVCVFCAATALSATASTVYTVTATGGALTAPLKLDDQQVEIYDADAGTTVTVPFSSVTFKANSVFRKRGEGYLMSSLKMGGFTGEIRIEEGAFLICTNNMLGANLDKNLAPTVVVSNNATFAICGDATTVPMKTMTIWNAISLQGAGYDGCGAFLWDMSVPQTYIFNGHWSLQGDTVIRSRRAERWDYYGRGTLELNGHNLTYARHRDATKPANWGFCDTRFEIAEGTSSKVCICDENFQVENALASGWNGDSQSELVLSNSTMLTEIKAPLAPWRLHVVGDVGSTVITKKSDKNFEWQGPVQLDQQLILDPTDYGIGSYSLMGVISGDHGIWARNCKVTLGNARNDFTGTTGFVNVPGLTLAHNGELPATCAQSAFTNTPVSFSSREHYDLPPVDFHVPANEEVSVAGGFGAATSCLRKSGPGALYLETPFSVTNGDVEVLGGTLRLRNYIAGIIGGRRVVDTTGSYQITDGDGAVYTDISGYVRNTRDVITNCVERGPMAATSGTLTHWFYDYTGLPTIAAMNKYSVATIYEGYIWNRSGETEYWTFSGSFGTHTEVRFDDEELYLFWKYDRNEKQTVTVPPGAHKLRLASYNSMNATGAACVNGKSFSSGTWTVTVGGVQYGGGVRFDRKGRGSTDVAKYEPLVDPGDGSLLTISTNGLGCTAGEVPAWKSLRVGPSALLDVQGNSFTLDTLSGSGTITNGNVYFDGAITVTNRFHYTAADAKNAEPLKLHVPLAFAEGAVFDTGDLSAYPHAHKPIVVCTAPSIEGMPEFDNQVSGAASRWTLRKSADGKSLTFEYNSGMTVFIR